MWKAIDRPEFTSAAFSRAKRPPTEPQARGLKTEAEARWVTIEWLALGRRIEELELVEAQDTLVNLAGLLARAYDFDYVTERRDDEHLNRLRKYRPVNDDAWLQFTRVHLTPPVTILPFMADLPFISGQELPRTRQWNEVAEGRTSAAAMKYSVIRTTYDPNATKCKSLKT